MTCFRTSRQKIDNVLLNTTYNIDSLSKYVHLIINKISLLGYSFPYNLVIYVKIAEGVYMEYIHGSVTNY
jgi:hypothetical protein